ncbi:hypothetical protein OG920_02025 [Streptomyces europaeiscabiei]|uniref:hypothetical protein n=1 Tax=Streptomyces TaxID=1883 RepID=UPI000A36F263|nr:MULTISPECIES: hypothetical protein [Streptomyces]MDX3588947.1 hypothetical protein [Streptomyces europaeiscabiei]MDX3612273.1 hypothetical protein [Streptomyces europaeiscabiei]MDX3637214.1 hypothetical protein [Streptomyces europaeiscabiei]MDX3654794.1 hypothetical protein [Streptomyces europaeiscabiei]WUD30320.1 hypothetical protein OG858_02085 [Streptomyces europaeiscabiei]
MAVLAVSPTTIPAWVVAALMVLVGTGGPLTMPSLPAQLLGNVPVPAHRAGVVGAIALWETDDVDRPEHVTHTEHGGPCPQLRTRAERVLSAHRSTRTA